ncbi:MAG: hypothetical protein JWM27_3237 [Gemmatimonadetes bacterium]|nr:hypothetical protein [Gemmatimonadota bacterium]
MDDGEAPVRERTFTWDDPMLGARLAPTLSGMDYLGGMIRGEYPAPPIAAALGFWLETVEPGRAVFAAVPAEFQYNPIGVVHGGFTATLCDSAMACAVHSTLPAGTGYTTLEMKVSLVRAITVDTGRVTCEGTVIHAGGRVATAEARITDAAGRLYAHATSTCIILRGGPAGK